MPICPHLGLRYDADSVHEFPSSDNRCFHAEPAGEIRRDYQSAACLTEGHTACPVYRAPAPVAVLPPEIAAPQDRSLRIPQRVLSWSGVAVLLLLAAFVFSPLNELLAPLGRSRYGAGEWGGPPAVFPNPGGQPTEGLLFAFTPSPRVIHPDCDAPDGWVVYVVNPTDSLVRLSLVYNIPLETLQGANCLVPGDVIRPGDRIWVPFIPTLTPAPTRTPTRAGVIRVPPTATNRPAGGGPAVPPTPIPPSLTPVPSTATPTPTVVIILPTATVTETLVPPTPVPPTDTLEPSPTSPPVGVLPPTVTPTDGSIIIGLIRTILPPQPTSTPAP